MERAMGIEDLLHPYLGKYLEAPNWVKASAGRAYRALPASVRLGEAYERFRDQVGEGAQGGPMAKLDTTLRWALETVPAYAQFRGLLKGSSDPRDLLEKLPVTDKLDIKRYPERYLSRAMPPSARLETFTGGSTRNPMRFFLQKHVTRPKEYAFIQDFRARVGGDPADVALALRGRSVPSAAEPDGKLWMYEPIRRQLILSTDHLERRFMPRYAEALALHRPAWIEAFPSAIYPLARWLAENPLPEFTRNVRGLMLYSENVHEAHLAKLREVFDCPVIAHYGHSERVLMAASMPGDDRYFFWPQYGHFELLDERDRPITQPGRVGFIVGTSFDNQVMPFVRYRTGDMAMLSDRGHPQLPGFTACEQIVGRLQEFVVCRDERLMSITTLGVAHFPELARVDAIQYEQRTPGRLALKVAAEERLAADVLERIAAAVARKTQGGCEVEATQVGRIERTPRGKARMIVQHLDVRRYFGVSP
jgi:phenylacetate-coenzyme A ligase PaaK-like adenylate-forming protein